MGDVSLRIVKQTEYLAFAEVIDPASKRKTKVWQVLSVRHGDVLGVISWYGSWRQYVHRPHPNTLWNSGCLDEVAAFLREQMEARRG